MKEGGSDVGKLSEAQAQAIRERWLREDYIGIGPLRDDLTALLDDREEKARRIAELEEHIRFALDEKLVDGRLSYDAEDILRHALRSETQPQPEVMCGTCLMAITCGESDVSDPKP